MGYIIVTRNPRDKKLIVIGDADFPDQISEFETENAAEDAAKDVRVCQAWGHQVVEVE